MYIHVHVYVLIINVKNSLFLNLHVGCNDISIVVMIHFALWKKKEKKKSSLKMKEFWTKPRVTGIQTVEHTCTWMITNTGIQGRHRVHKRKSCNSISLWKRSCSDIMPMIWFKLAYVLVYLPPFVIIFTDASMAPVYHC